MAKGIVKWFNNAKGFGFISADEEENIKDDIFVHYSTIKGDGYKTLFRGQSVIFDTIQGDKGYHATDVVGLAVEGMENMPNLSPAETEEPATQE